MAANTQPIAVIARLLDLTERRVQQLGREGIIPRAERGRYDLVGAVRGYVRYLREQAARAHEGVADFGAERARLVKAKADLAEMEAAQRRSELLPADRVEEAWTAVLARLRSRLLVLPDRMAPLVHEETTIAGARAVIRRVIAEALTELAQIAIEVAADPERTGAPGPGDAQGAGHPDAAARPEHQ
jgi:phage terminase Nu1 subunit (DNA packaging protein)